MKNHITQQRAKNQKLLEALRAIHKNKPAERQAEGQVKSTAPATSSK